ncbi:MAG: hypothetical protein QXX36_03955 [Candidatus Rehaiarchaeum fermentans]|nr:hypothetical protein [Candidatus Rehaiarchaeum fermentans]
MEAPRIELENYIETYFMHPAELPELLRYTKYEIVKDKYLINDVDAPEDGVYKPIISTFYAKIKGQGKKWIETIFTEEELKDASNKLLVHNKSLPMISHASLTIDDYILVYNPKKLVEIKGHRLLLTYSSLDPYVVEKIQYLTRGALRLFAVFEPKRYNSFQEFLNEYKDEFTKRLVTDINKWCYIRAFSRVFGIAIRLDLKPDNPMCLFFDVV